MKFLSIIIPFYKEVEQDIFPLLSSINFQKGIDLSQIEVILVNDGAENVLSSDFLDLFKNLKIYQYQLSENKGPGMARQKGLDNAKSKYVMFCDCDDILHNVGILGAMLLEMEQTSAEYLSTQWLEEMGDGTFFNHEMEQTWLHGKMFLRNFLEINDINFHDNLRVHEDTYFLKLVTSLCKNRSHLNTCSYIWLYNPHSITRCNNAIYGFECMPEFIFAVVEAIKKLNVDIEQHVCQLVIYIYFIAQSKEWQTENSKQYLEKMINSLALNISNYWCYFDNAGEEFINNIYSIEFAKKTVRDIPKVNLYEFVEEVKKLSS